MLDLTTEPEKLVENEAALQMKGSRMIKGKEKVEKIQSVQRSLIIKSGLEFSGQKKRQ